MSKNYNKVKYYYDNSLWTITMVRNSVNKWITVDEYKEITGESYVVDGN